MKRKVLRSLQTISYLFLGLAITVLFSACKNNTDVSEVVGEDTEFFAIPLKTASAADVAEYIVDCPGRGNVRQICVQICHVPPGNPDARHDKILPLQATAAHLDHGGHDHVEKDYLGLCYPVSSPDDGSSDGSSGDDGSSDGSSGDDGSSDGSSGDDGSSDGSTGDELIPEWCLENYDIDSNCDGINDTTGDPLF